MAERAFPCREWTRINVQMGKPWASHDKAKIDEYGSGRPTDFVAAVVSLR
jgi:hypothetical protein